MNEAQINQVGRFYGYKVHKVFAKQKGYRNESYHIVISPLDSSFPQTDANLILYKNDTDILKRINAANLVSNYLFSKGFPTRLTISGNKICCVRLKDGKKRYVCLYNYLPGNTIPWEGYTMKHIKLLGKVMAEMHKELRMQSTEQKAQSSKEIEKSGNPKIENISHLTSHIPYTTAHISYPISHIPNVITELRELQQRMKIYFENKDVVAAMKQKLELEINDGTMERWNEVFDALERNADKQILHMDFVRSNVLFQENSKIQKSKIKKKNFSTNYFNLSPDTFNLSVSGILDFEKTALGPTIIDIARTLAFLIVDCKYKSEEKVRKYFLKSGYEKRGEEQLKNVEFLDELLKFFWLHDFYKFLRHNPYEYLRQNEHYVRSVNLLWKRSCLIIS